MGPGIGALPRVMIVLSWDCKGVGQPATVHALCELIKDQRPDIVFLCKTLAMSARLESVRLKIKFPNCFSVNCNGRSGGLGLFWNDKVSCTLRSYSLNHIDMDVEQDNLKWRLTGYYGYPERSRRHLSWNLLRTLASQNSSPWVCVGDFNDLLWARDKRGRVDHPQYVFRGFRVAVDFCWFVDVPLVGHQYTWSRGKGSPGFVEERLERTMANDGWHSLFPHARLVNLVAPISDHNPILLEMSPTSLVRRHRKFKFENKWFEEETLPSVVVRCWDGFKDFEVTKRLLATAEMLEAWRDHIQNTFRRNKK